MFDDNIVVNNIYRKINEIENLDAEKNKQIKGFYLFKITLTICIIFTGLLIFKIISLNQLIIFSLLGVMAISIALAVEIIKTRSHTKKYLLASQEVKSEVYDYLSKPHVQKELVKFFQLTFGNKTIDELKKLFAFKEYMGAYLYIDKIIQKFLEIEKQKEQQIRNEEMIQQCENNMKKASRAKLKLVQ